MPWRLLGSERFRAAYALGLQAAGYRNRPLEVMAYDAEECFARSDHIEYRGTGLSSAQSIAWGKFVN
jgi:hypothetical protein